MPIKARDRVDNKHTTQGVYKEVESERDRTSYVTVEVESDCIDHGLFLSGLN